MYFRAMGSHFRILAIDQWDQYELLDCGNFQKLERFGDFVLIRPEPQALWEPQWSINEWEDRAFVVFEQKTSNSGEWNKMKSMPDKWTINYSREQLDLKFRLSLTGFKHVGIFPEQADNWHFIFNQCKKFNNPKVLNLFAYTGGASLAAKAAGADVVHVDSIRQVVGWAKENMELSGLTDIRWTVEDAVKFVQREVKRGHKYQGIILDPPAFGLGTSGERWKLEEKIQPLLEDLAQLLDDKGFLVLNMYSLGLSAIIAENLVLGNFGNVELEYGEVYLPAQSGVKLPLGVYARFSR